METARNASAPATWSVILVRINFISMKNVAKPLVLQKIILPIQQILFAKIVILPAQFASPTLRINAKNVKQDIFCKELVVKQVALMVCSHQKEFVKIAIKHAKFVKIMLLSVRLAFLLRWLSTELARIPVIKVIILLMALAYIAQRIVSVA